MRKATKHGFFGEDAAFGELFVLMENSQNTVEIRGDCEHHVCRTKRIHDVDTNLIFAVWIRMCRVILTAVRVWEAEEFAFHRTSERVSEHRRNRELHRQETHRSGTLHGFMLVGTTDRRTLRTRNVPIRTDVL